MTASRSFQWAKSSLPALAATLAVVPFCPVWVDMGDNISVDVFYAHEQAPGLLYTLHLGPTIAWESGEASVVAEGHPVDCRWTVNGHEVVFYDGFETGRTRRWE